MSRFTNKKFMMSVKHAINGFVACFKSQRNFKYQLLIFLLICVLAYIFKYTILEFTFCTFTIFLVLIVEMLNSCIEFVLDAVYRSRYSILVKVSKDISAGAVLLSSIACAIVNGLVLISKLF